MKEDKKSIIIVVLAYMLYMGYNIWENGFNIPVLALLTLLLVVGFLVRKYIFEHWDDKPYLKYTIGLLILYIILLIERKY